jgi:hypothetical protein
MFRCPAALKISSPLYGMAWGQIGWLGVKSLFLTIRVAIDNPLSSLLFLVGWKNSKRTQPIAKNHRWIKPIYRGIYYHEEHEEKAGLPETAAS